MNEERLDDVLAAYSGLKDGEVEDYTAGHPFEYRVEYRAGKAGAGAEAGFGVPRAKSRRRWAGGRGEFHHGFSDQNLLNGSPIP